MSKVIQKIPELKKWLSPTEWMVARGEIAQLPNVLWEGEYPEYAAAAIYSGGICLIVPTNLRLILIDKKIFDMKVDGMSYNRIDTIEYDRGLFFGYMNIMLPGRALELRYVGRDSIAKLCELINEHVSRHHNFVSQPTAPQQIMATIEQPEDNMDRVLNQLERLSRLRNSGTLTDQEFFVEKEIVLSSQPHLLEESRKRWNAYRLGAGRQLSKEQNYSA